ncbi:MAG: hypothetical protein AB8G96_07570 [Phycisphaerales bacterium]
MARGTSRSSSGRKKSNRKKKSAASGGGLIAAIGGALASLRDWMAAISDAVSRAFAGPWVEAASWVTVVLVIAGTWWLAVPKLDARVRGATVDGASRVELSASSRPEWMKAELVREIEARVAERSAGEPMEREPLLQIGEALLETGWYGRVDQVRRVAPDHVVVDAVPLRPFALVRDRTGDHLVDPDGRLMPRTFASGTMSSLTVIEGVRGGRPVQPGEVWGDPGLRAGLKLLATLRSRPWSSQVNTVDVADFERTSDLAFTTDRGARFEWRRLPGAEGALEPGAERKLEMLDYAAETSASGRIDGGFGGRWSFSMDRLWAE